MAEIKTLSLDLESFSSIDLSKCGVYRYVEAPDFEILLFGYSINGGEVHVVDLACGESVPEEILSALTDDSVLKWAFNASFERICISAWLRRHHPEYFRSYSITDDTVGDYLDPASWRCSMVWSAYMGLPLSLKGVGQVLKLEDQKMDEGKALIKYFSVPCAPTKVNEHRRRNLPEHAPEKWKLFKAYNRRDVEVEMAIQNKLRNFPVPDFVWDEYALDQEINDRGIAVDMDFVEQALAFDERSKAELEEEMKELTGLENPNSVMQMKKWLSDNGFEVDSLGKKEVTQMIKDAPEPIKTVLSLRLQLAKSSVRKYTAMKNAVCEDGRARGMFKFYGASRTGREAGSLIQLQNLPRNYMMDLEQARNFVRSGDYEMASTFYDDIPDTLSQLVRTAFVPKKGCKFIVADFSAIEARVLAWLAGEQWVLDVFANGGDIYCETAARMFHCKVEKRGENSDLRAKGKQATLSCGYGGSVGALKAMGAIEAGMKEEELQPLVDAWRAANPKIVQLWWDVDRAVKNCIKGRKETVTHGIRFIYQSGMMFAVLPSGRRLTYVKPQIGVNRFGGESATYMGLGTTKKWERIESYGPKFVENLIQSISRDILFYAMKTLRHCRIVAHVHDEVIIEASPEVSVEAICEQMGRTPPWVPGLILRADGYETMFYKKD